MIRSPEAEPQFAQFAAVSRLRAPPAATTLLHGALFLTIAVSGFVLFEPAPYEVAATLLALTCVIAGVRVDRNILPLILLLLVFNIGGAMTLLPITDNREAIIFAVTSFYLAMTAVVFACVLADDSMRRLEILRRAYFVAAFFAALAGIAAYFGFFPDGTLYGRARATFKDPNVFGPFLVLPLLFLLQSIISRGLKLRYLFLFCVLAFGLLLSFSRGAWSHFALSAAIVVVLTFLTAPDIRTRARLMLISLVSAGALAGLVAVALSFGTIGEMFQERAKVTQSYDVGSGGRFSLQETAVGAVLENPNGMGPFEFARVYGLQQHNVYLQAFLVYGWIGGASYIALVLLTLAVGFRFVFVSTPWQPYLIAAFATFCGEVVEGFVIDTDHWRHFFLLLGMIWGLVAATIKATRSVPLPQGRP